MMPLFGPWVGKEKRAGLNGVGRHKIEQRLVGVAVPEPYVARTLAAGALRQTAQTGQQSVYAYKPCIGISCSPGAQMTAFSATNIQNYGAPVRRRPELLYNL